MFTDILTEGDFIDQYKERVLIVLPRAEISMRAETEHVYDEDDRSELLLSFLCSIPEREREECVKEVTMGQQVFAGPCSGGDGQPLRFMGAKGQRSPRGFC